MNPGYSLLIAGSGSGIGRALAEHYAGRGHKVIGFSRRTSDFNHDRYSHFQANASDPGEIDAMLSQLTGTALDILVYCAGITFPKYTMLLSDKEAAAILDANLLGAFMVTRRVLRGMKRRKFGRVIFFSSIAVPLGHAGSVIYGASKAGLEQMAFSLSREFSDDNITFNSVGISIYPSPMLAAMSPEGLTAARKGLVKSKDLGIDEIAGAIDYFASDAARQVTGQTLYFGGVR